MQKRTPAVTGAWPVPSRYPHSTGPGQSACPRVSTALQFPLAEDSPCLGPRRVRASSPPSLYPRVTECLFAASTVPSPGVPQRQTESPALAGRAGGRCRGGWPPGLGLTALRPAGFVLDSTDSNFSYVFYMSSFFIVSSALFMGGGFCALQRKERQGRPAGTEAAIPEAAPLPALPGEDPGSAEKQPCTEEITYVTSV